MNGLTIAYTIGILALWVGLGFLITNNWKRGGIGLTGSAILGVIAALINGIFVYLTCLPFVPSFILWLLAINGGIALIVIGLMADRESAAAIGIVLIVAFVILWFVGVGLVVATSAQNLAHTAPVEYSNTTSDQIDTRHIRLVSIQTAMWRADKVVGDLGYKVSVYNPDIQYRNGRLVWVVPLDYTSDVKAWTYAQEGTEGYIVVDAEDPKAEVQLVTDIPMRYTPNAIFSRYILRDIWDERPTLLKHDPVFQLDDQGKPVYVTMLSKPLLAGIIGEQPVEVCVTDPVTGQNTFYPVGKEPAWVQRVWDEGLVEEWITWWGKYQDGWVNALWGQRDLKIPTGGISVSHSDSSGPHVVMDSTPDVFLVNGKDGNLYWFSAITAPGKDASMVGYMMTNVKTGEFVFHETPGWYNDYGAAANIQQHQLVSMAPGLEVVQPIMYVMKGQAIWIAPVITQSGEQMLVGVVDASTGRTYVDYTLDGALLQLIGKDYEVPDNAFDTDIYNTIAAIQYMLDDLKDELKERGVK